MNNSVLVSFDRGEGCTEFGAGDSFTAYLFEFNGGLDVAPGFEEVAAVPGDGRDVSERITLAVLVSNRAPDIERLAQGFERLVRPAQLVQCATHAIERRGLAERFCQFAPNRE